MAGTGLIHCVLIQALLITVYGNSSKTQFEIICPSVTGTMGEPLHLTCDVPCDGCEVKQFFWTKEQGPDLSCHDKPTHYDKSLTFHCTIQSASEKHNGEFKFWVQLGNGNSHTLFNVRLELAPTAPTKPQVISVSPGTPDGVPDPGKHKRDKENNRSYGGIVAMVVMLSCLAIIMGAFILRNKKNKSMSSSALDIMI